MKNNIVDIAVRAPKVLRVDGTDYRLQFGLPAVIVLEEKLGRSMKFAGDWLRIQSKELPDILEAGLSRHHPAEAADVAAQIGANLEPEEIEKVIEALCYAACPIAMERLDEHVRKVQESARKGISPNVPSVAAR